MPSSTPTKTPRTSLSPPESGGASRSREGRTPPPAPSAAYARRAREIMEDEGMLIPSVSVADLGGEVVGPQEAEEVEVEVGFGGYRRARAGLVYFSIPDLWDGSVADIISELCLLSYKNLMVFRLRPLLPPKVISELQHFHLHTQILLPLLDLSCDTHPHLPPIYPFQSPLDPALDHSDYHLMP